MKKIYLFFLLPLLVACDPGNNNYKFEYSTIVTNIPASLDGINSQYDDYNSNLPYPAARLGIYFSSNRESAGNNFNIIHKNLDISYHEKDDILNIEYTGDDLSTYQNTLLSLIASDNDEYGPNYYFGPDGIDYFFYADDERDDFDIKFVWNNRGDFGTSNGSELMYGPSNFESSNGQEEKEVLISLLLR